MKTKYMYWRPLVAICIWGGFGLNALAGQNEWTTELLMEKLSAVKEAELTFVERKYSFFLIDKLKITGRLIYRAPDFIQKLIESPFTENIEIAGDKISIEKFTARGESTIQNYSISSSDELQAAVEGIRATLAGDLNVLLKSYQLKMTGSESNWMVVLIPINVETRQRIEKIEISGNSREIKLIETFNTDGDETSLALSYIMIK